MSLAVGVGPQVNKFEQVSSVDHQMSLAGVGMSEGYVQGVSLSRGRYVRRGGRWVSQVPCPM